MKSVIIIGAGQLGSRHLQALAKSSLPLDIDVLDTAPDSLLVASKRWHDVKPSVSRASFISEMPVGKNYDMAIIATTAKSRAEVSKRFLTANDTPYILFEKFLFTRIHEYFDIGELLQKRNIQAWVNCPRRIYPIFQELRPYFQGPLHLSYTGGEWGLACNSVHMADLAAFLSGQSDFLWQMDYLDQEIIASKRSGYVEFTGTLLGRGSNGGSIHLYSRGGSSLPPFLELVGDCAAARLDESNNQGVLYRRENGWLPEPLLFKVPFQSELTHLVLEELINEGRSSLTPYQESLTLHLPLLSVFLQHWARLGHSPRLCPIT